MAVSKSEWAKLTWSERINIALKDLNINVAELARRLNVSRRTVEYWRAGTKIPSEKFIRLLRSWCISEAFEDLREESYMALHTMSADASARLLENACLSRDPMMLAMASHCIAIKISALIKHTCTQPNNLIIYIKSLYGDSSTHINIVNALVPDVNVDILVHAPLDDSPLFTITTYHKKNNITVMPYAFVVADKALVTIAKRVIKFLNA